MLNADGSQVYYYKGDGPATSMPTRGSCPRQYFSQDESRITLSREGWIEFVNKFGQKTTLSAEELDWRQFANQQGWFGSSPKPASSAPVASKTRLSDPRRDSVVGGGGRRRQSKGKDDEGTDGGGDSDGYDDGYKFWGPR